MTPEARARQTIDTLLTAAGWHVCDIARANLHAGSGAVKGVAIREFPLNAGHDFADYLLYVNGKACGVIEAKREGATLSGVEVQSARYAPGPARRIARLAPAAALRVRVHRGRNPLHQRAGPSAPRPPAVCFLPARAAAVAKDRRATVAQPHCPRHRARC